MDSPMDRIINQVGPVARPGQIVKTSCPVRGADHVVFPANCECVVEQSVMVSRRYKYLLLHPSGLSVWAEGSDLKC